MKWYSKIWEWLCLVFFGMIAGIVIFIKFLDKPEYEVIIKKIKNKKISGGTIDNNVVINVEKEKTKKEIRTQKRIDKLNEKIRQK